MPESRSVARRVSFAGGSIECQGGQPPAYAKAAPEVPGNRLWRAGLLIVRRNGNRLRDRLPKLLSRLFSSCTSRCNHRASSRAQAPPRRPPAPRRCPRRCPQLWRRPLPEGSRSTARVAIDQARRAASGCHLPRTGASIAIQESVLTIALTYRRWRPPPMMWLYPRGCSGRRYSRYIGYHNCVATASLMPQSMAGRAERHQILSVVAAASTAWQVVMHLQ